MNENNINIEELMSLLDEELVGKFIKVKTQEEFTEFLNSLELTDDQKTKLYTCKFPENHTALSDEQLNAVLGGVSWPDCPVYQPGQNAPIPENLEHSPRPVHLIKTNIVI